MAARSKSSKGRSDPHPEAAAQQVARSLIEQQLATAEKLIPAVLQGDDPEDLHDLRVALRRARSLAQLLGDTFAERPRRDLVAQLRALADCTGRLRDLDVHLEAREAQLGALPRALLPAGERVFAELGRLRDDAHAELGAELASDTYRERLASLRERLADPGAWADGPLAQQSIRSVAVRALEERYESVCKRGTGLTLETEESQVHKLRIACKKLRYAVEFLTPVLDDRRALSRLLRRLKRAQDALGHFNDCTVQRDRLAHHDWGGDDPQRTLAAGALLGMLHAELSAARPALLKHSERLCDASIAKRLAGLR